MAILALALIGCQAPISTVRSPYHLRVVEIRNTTADTLALGIEPAAGQHLGAATTFTGVLKPGEVKTLYLYHGFEYVFRILEDRYGDELARSEVEVERNLGLEFAGDSLEPDLPLLVEFGQPEMIFADSLTREGVFDMRRETIAPDSMRGRGGLSADSATRREQLEQREREAARSGKVP